MARAIYINKVKKPPVKSLRVTEDLDLGTGYRFPEKRNDDFHVNPSQIGIELAELKLETIICAICGRFSSGNLFECKEGGHVYCEDCYTLKNPDDGCLILVGQWKDRPCCSTFWNQLPSKALATALAAIKFRCLSNACQERIPGGQAWKHHLENCSALNNFICCPDPACTKTSIFRNDFEGHCEKVHAVSLLVKKENKSYHFGWNRTKFEDGPTIAAILQYEGRSFYLVGRNEEPNCIRFAAFMVQRDCKWATPLRIALTMQDKQDRKISAQLKINPSERNWNDVKIFGRSQLLLFAQLDAIFYGEKEDAPVNGKHYEFQLSFVDVSKVDAEGAWEEYPEEVVDMEVEETSPCSTSVRAPNSNLESMHAQYNTYSSPFGDEVPYEILVEEEDDDDVDYSTRFSSLPNICSVRIFDDNN